VVPQHPSVNKGKAILLLALMLLVPMSGCEDGSNVSDEQYQTTKETYIVITLAAPVMHRRTVNASDVWDVTLDITDINPNTAMVPWIEVHVSVKGADGSMLITSTIPEADGGVYDTAPEAWYQEISGNGQRANVGDALRVTSLDTAFEGATVQLTRQGEVLATATLPGTFW
jgi:hypothetical protein